MAPEAKRESLLYVSDTDGVHIFSYTNGTQVGDLDIPPTCRPLQ
jgi:hypothetical protein